MPLSSLHRRAVSLCLCVWLACLSGAAHSSSAQTPQPSAVTQSPAQPTPTPLAPPATETTASKKPTRIVINPLKKRIPKRTLDNQPTEDENVLSPDDVEKIEKMDEYFMMQAD